MRVGLGRRFVLAAVGVGSLGLGLAWATPPLSRKAKEMGFPSDDCSYCHSFDMSHMKERARAMGISSMNCYTCHGDKLPKMGKALFNERGWWLVQQKDQRKEKAVDLAWLKDYVEPPGKKPEKAPEQK